MDKRFLMILLIPFIFGFVFSRYGPWWGLREQGTAPDTPSNGIKLYADSNNDLFVLQETGTSTLLNSPTSLGNPATSGTLSIGSGSITDSSGAISFGDETLSTTGNVTITGIIDLGDAISLEIPNNNGDVTADAGGELFYDESDDQFVFYDSQGGELSGNEAAFTAIKPFRANVDPGLWYDSDEEIFLGTIGDEAPNGFIIDEWKLSCNCDPDVEIDADLYYADDWITLANPVVIDSLDTTNGISSEDTDANINGGLAIPNGKTVYMKFNLDPEGPCTQMIFEGWGHAID